MRKERVKKQAMRNLTQSQPWSPAMVALLAGCWLFAGIGRSDDTLPKGFDVSRYQQLWERNPFTLVTPSLTGPESPFSKLILVNWLHDKGKDVVFVQDTETNDVKKVTTEEGGQLRLLEVVPNKNPSLIFAKLSNGKEEGIVKFRFDQASGGQTFTQSPTAGRVLPGQNPVVRNPGVQPPGFQNRMVNAPRLPGQPENQPNGGPVNPNSPPDAQQIRRRRMLPTPQETPEPVQQQQVPQQNNNNGAADSDDDE